MPAAVIESGTCLAVPLRRGLFGAARVVEIHPKHGLVVEAVQRFGSTPASLADVERAPTLEYTDVINGLLPLSSFIVPTARLPRTFVVLGKSARRFPTVSTYYGSDWTSFAYRILEEWTRRQGKDPYAAVAAEERRRDGERAKRQGIDPKLLRLKEEATEVLGMWRRGEYDNSKDAIQDARSLLPKAQRLLPELAERLERMLEKVTSELSREAAKDPRIAQYSRGLLPKPRTRKRGR